MLNTMLSHATVDIMVIDTRVMETYILSSMYKEGNSKFTTDDYGRKHHTSIMIVCLST